MMVAVACALQTGIRITFHSESEKRWSSSSHCMFCGSGDRSPEGKKCAALGGILRMIQTKCELEWLQSCFAAVLAAQSERSVGFMSMLNAGNVLSIQMQSEGRTAATPNIENFFVTHGKQMTALVCGHATFLSRCRQVIWRFHPVVPKTTQPAAFTKIFHPNDPPKDQKAFTEIEIRKDNKQSSRRDFLWKTCAPNGLLTRRMDPSSEKVHSSQWNA